MSYADLDHNFKYKIDSVPKLESIFPTQIKTIEKLVIYGPGLVQNPLDGTYNSFKTILVVFRRTVSELV